MAAASTVASQGSSDCDCKLSDRRQAPLVACLPAPVIDQLVAGDPDQPGNDHLPHESPFHGVACGEKCLGSEVFGEGPVAAPGFQVAVDGGQGMVVDVEQRPGVA